MNPPHIMPHLLPLFFLQSQITSTSFCHIAFYALLWSEHLPNCFELSVYFSSLQPTVFINRDYFGNEGYNTVEIRLIPGGAYTLRKSGVVRLQAWEAGCLGFNLLLSSSVTSVRHINSLSMNAFIGKVKLMKRVVRIKGVHNCLGSHLASADQGWFLHLFMISAQQSIWHTRFISIYTCQMNKFCGFTKKKKKL